MPAARRFEELTIWTQARQLAADIDKRCTDGRLRHQYVLTDQLRRAAISVMSNVAEGFDRRSARSFRAFLFVAKGSAAEVRSLLCLCADRGYLSPDDARDLMARADDLGKMLAALIAHLERVIRGQSP